MWLMWIEHYFYSKKSPRTWFDAHQIYFKESKYFVKNFVYLEKDLKIFLKHNYFNWINLVWTWNNKEINSNKCFSIFQTINYIIYQFLYQEKVVWAELALKNVHHLLILSKLPIL